MWTTLGSKATQWSNIWQPAYYDRADCGCLCPSATINLPTKLNRLHLSLQPKMGKHVSPESRDDQLIVHHLSLLERSRYYGKFIMSLPFGTAAKIVFWTVLMNQRKAISIAMT